jgi:UrcA family protein
MCIRSISRSKALVLSGLALASLMSTAAFSIAEAADQFTQPRSVRVSWRELDLSRAEGQQALHRRLRNAVEIVCGDVNVRSLTERAHVARCRQNTLSRSLVQIGALTASAPHVASIAARR